MQLKALLDKIKSFGGNTFEYFWITALLGELGEVCNEVKKRKRDHIDNTDALLEEISDSFIYIVLLCRLYGVTIIEVVNNYIPSDRYCIHANISFSAFVNIVSPHLNIDEYGCGFEGLEKLCVRLMANAGKLCQLVLNRSLFGLYMESVNMSIMRLLSNLFSMSKAVSKNEHFEEILLKKLEKVNNR